MKLKEVTPEFVDEIPHKLEYGRLYICYRYRIVTHQCACGCGIAVNTPLHPTDWTLIYNGESVSIWPSIGNWGEDCRSHYWIRNNKIVSASKWSKKRILFEKKAHESEIERYLMESIKTDTDFTEIQEFKSSSIWTSPIKRFFNCFLKRK